MIDSSAPEKTARRLGGEGSRVRRDPAYAAGDGPGAEETGERPDSSLGITRRIFLHKSFLAGTAAGAATYGWFPSSTHWTSRSAPKRSSSPGSPTITSTKDVNTRFVDKATRAVKDVQAMSPPAIS